MAERLRKKYNPSSFKIGDIVTIRKWDDMMDEFGGTDDSLYDIQVPFIFTSNMKKYCGCRLVVVRIVGKAYTLVHPDDRRIFKNFSVEMFEHKHPSLSKPQLEFNEELL